MVVKFFRPKHAKAGRNNKIAVGQLVGSRTYHNTDVRQEEEEDAQEFDNVSALELALNHSDTVGVNAGAKSDAKKLHNFGLFSTMVTRRRSVQSALPPTTQSPKLRSVVEENRDDCTDELFGSNASHRGAVTKIQNLSTSDTKTTDQHSKAGSEPIQSPLLVNVIPESLTGLIFKRYSQSIKSSNKKIEKSGNGMKVKGYLRVVRKAAGVKIVSGSPKIVKSYRLGAPTVTNTIPNHSMLIWSNESTGIKSTGSLLIRVPASSSANGKLNYDVLTFEVGVITPEGIFPLGTTVYQPFSTKVNEVNQKHVLKVDPILKGSLFQRRKPVMTPTSVSSTVVIDKDPCYRLQRKSALSLIIDVKPISEKEYVLLKQKKDPEVNVVDALPKSRSSPAGEKTQELGNDNIPLDGTVSTELQNMHSEPTSGIIMYLSDPLSCCSDRDVDSDNEAEEVVPDDAKTQVTDPSTDFLNDDENVQVAIKRKNLKQDEPIQEVVQKREIDSKIESHPENSGWCFFFPVCCCVGSSDKSMHDVPTVSGNIDNNASVTLMNDVEISAIPTSNTLVYDAVVQKQYIDKDIKSNEEEKVVKEKIDTSRHRYSEEINDLLQSHSFTEVLQDEPVGASRNCCMVCFGDEDVENLRYTRFRTIKEPLDVLNNEMKDVAPVSALDKTDCVERSVLLQGEGNEREQVPVHVSGGSIQNIGSDNAVVEEKLDNDRSQTLSRLDAALNTMSSSYTEDHDDDDDDSAYSVSYYDDVDVDVGCFQWMGAVSSDGAESLHSMSVVSSESHVDSLAGMTEGAGDKIPISRSVEVPVLSAVPDVNHKLQSNSIS
jgi:hypothetical protein